MKINPNFLICVIYFILTVYFFIAFHGIDTAYNMKYFEGEFDIELCDRGLHGFCIPTDEVYMINIIIVISTFIITVFVSLFFIFHTKGYYEKNKKG